mgnify:FL=1
MISVLEARDLVRRSLSPLSSEIIPIREAVGRVIVEGMSVREESPGFDNSAMDGYAVRPSDLSTLPAELEVEFEIPTGTLQPPQLSPGKAARIFTGAMLPDGADAVIMQEHVEILENSIRISQAVNQGNCIRKRGEDLELGKPLVGKGEILTAVKSTLLASQGVHEVNVFKKPSVGFVVTGNELCFEGSSLKPGMVRSCNGEIFTTVLSSAAEEMVDYEWVRDDPQELFSKVSMAKFHDVFLISGGASVGKYDYTHEIIKELGYEIHFNKVAIRPGKPLIFATCGSNAIFGIPGNPVSSYVSCFLFVLDALYALSGHSREPRRVLASLGNPVHKPANFEMYQRGNLTLEEGEQRVYTNLNQSSGAMGALASADCLVVLPTGKESLSEGERVEVLPFPDGENWN